MAMISDQEREELLRLAGSSSLRQDMEYLSVHRYNPVLVEGGVDLDRLVEFLTQFNEFINHEPKLFRRIIDAEMKL
jgi:hypothetical protein